MKRKTIADEISLSGLGLHTGKTSTIEFRPADKGSGIYFIHEGKKIEAHPKNVSSTIRGTNLLTISTVEHVLSAVYGLKISDLEIFLDGDEPPAMDGSAKPFVEALITAGEKFYDEEQKDIEIKTHIKIESKDSYIEIIPFNHLAIDVVIDYSHTIAGIVRASFDEKENDYALDIAPARTFGLLEEVEDLKKNGLAKGASFDNAIAITKDGYSSPLRFENELARHKILDIIGDISLIGCQLKGKITSYKAGHKLNIELARRILYATS